MKLYRNGPEVKLPEAKVPDFALDLYYDLRDRHLLPLVALLAIAIVAVPVALGQSSGPAPEAESAGGGTAAAESAGSEAAGHLVVAKAMPPLRDYRRRLRYLRAKDPFRQQYTSSGSSGESANSSGSSGSSSESSASGGGSSGSSTSTGGSSPSSTTSEPSGESGSTTTHKITYYSYAIDVRVVSPESQEGSSSATGQQEGTPASSSAATKSTVRRNLPELTMLPSRKTPAAIFMGVTKDRKKALMLISSNVQAVFGDGICVLGSKACQLMALEPGLPETFVYGPQARTFRIEVLKIQLLETDKLHRAPLGNRKKQHGKGH